MIVFEFLVHAINISSQIYQPRDSLDTCISLRHKFEANSNTNSLHVGMWFYAYSSLAQHILKAAASSYGGTTHQGRMKPGKIGAGISCFFRRLLLAVLFYTVIMATNADGSIY